MDKKKTAVERDWKAYALELEARLEQAENTCKQAQNELSQIKDETRLLIEHAPSGIYEIDLESTCFTSVNDAMCEMLGYSREELLGTSPFDLLNEDSKKILQERVQKNMAGEKIEPAVEYTVKTKDGREIVAALNTSIKYRNGKPSSAMVIAHDITERKQVERALRESEQRVVDFLESTNDSFFALNWEWRIIYANHRFCDYMKCSPEEVIGKNFWEQFPDYLGTPVEQAYRQVMEQRQPACLETGGIYTQNWFEVSIYPMRDGISVFSANRTEKHLAEQALADSEALLEAFFANSPGILNIVDEESRYVKTDALTPLYFGLDRQSIVGKAVKDLAPVLIEQYGPMLRQVLETGEPAMNEEMQNPVPGRNGEMAIWQTSFFPVPLPGGKRGIGIVGVEITERKLMEKALFESETRFRNLANNISQLAWMADGKGWIFWYNQRWFDYTGTTLEEMENLGWQKIHHPDCIQQVTEKINRCFATGEPWEDTFPLRGKDGEYRWFLSQAVPIKDENGMVTRWFGTHTDVTEQRELQQVLKKSEAKIRAVFQALTEGVVFLNPQGEVEEINDAVMRLHGHTLQELTDPEKDPRYKVIHPDGTPFPEEEQPAIKALRTGEMVRDIEMGVPMPDGRIQWRLVNAQPVYDDAGTLLGAVASFFDITDRKKAERELEESNIYLEQRVLERTQELKVALEELETIEEELRVQNEELTIISVRLKTLAEISQFLVDAGPNAMEVMDLVVKKAARLFGDACIMRLLSEDGKWLNPVAYYDLDPGTYQIMQNRLKSNTIPPGQEFYGEVFRSGIGKIFAIEAQDEWTQRIKDPFYSLYINKYHSTSIMVVPLRIKDKIVGTLSLIRNRPKRTFSLEELSFLQDVADRAAMAVYNARLYQDLEKAYQNEKVMRDQLIQAEKYSALARLVASVAHEINNPLQTVQNCLFLLQNETEPTSSSQFLEIAISEGRRMSSLVDQLRETYRPTNFQLMDFNLIEVLDKVQSLLAPQLRQNNIRWQMESDQEVILVNGVPDQIKQVFLNICINAIDALNHIAAPQLKVTVRTDPEEGRVCVAFQDNGPGISPEAKTMLFEPFFTTKEKGTGLGLSISYEIVRGHHGELTVESHPGQGAKFEVCLPRKDEG